jgi:hypothetical protein
MKLPRTYQTFALLFMSLVTISASASAAVFTFSTAPGSSVPAGAVNASATFTTGNGQLIITLQDLFANPTSAGQLVSDLDFSLSSPLAGAVGFSSSAQQITINSDGSSSIGGTGSTGWGFGSFGTGYIVCVICPSTAVLSANPAVNPSAEIIGPGPYTNANGSIAGNGPHNPFLNQTATFTISNSSITANTVVSGVTFSFGTSPGINVPGEGGGGGSSNSAVPEPASMSLLGGGVLGMLVLLRKFKKTV